MKIVSDGQTLASYQYDGAGRLDAEVTYSANQPSGITYEFHDGQNLIELASANYSTIAPPSPQSLTATYQYVWSPVGQQTVIERDYYGGALSACPPLLPLRRLGQRDGGGGTGVRPLAGGGAPTSISPTAA